MVADANLAARRILKGGGGEDVEGEGKHAEDDVGVDDKIVVGFFAGGGGDAVSESDAPAVGGVGAGVFEGASGHVEVAAQNVGHGKLARLFGGLAGEGEVELGARDGSILFEEHGGLGGSADAFFRGTVGRQVDAGDDHGLAVDKKGNADGDGKGRVSKVGGADALVGERFGEELERVAHEDGVDFLGAVGGGGAGGVGVGEAEGLVGWGGIVELLLKRNEAFLEEAFASRYFGEDDNVVFAEFFDDGDPCVL